MASAVFCEVSFELDVLMKFGTILEHESNRIILFSRRPYSGDILFGGDQVWQCPIVALEWSFIARDILHE